MDDLVAERGELRDGQRGQRDPQRQPKRRQRRRAKHPDADKLRSAAPASAIRSLIWALAARSRLLSRLLPSGCSTCVGIAGILKICITNFNRRVIIITKCRKNRQTPARRPVPRPPRRPRWRKAAISQSAWPARSGSTVRPSRSFSSAGACHALPNAHLAAECAQALGVSADWLLGLTERPERLPTCSRPRSA